MCQCQFKRSIGDGPVQCCCDYSTAASFLYEAAFMKRKEGGLTPTLERSDIPKLLYCFPLTCTFEASSNHMFAGFFFLVSDELSKDSSALSPELCAHSRFPQFQAWESTLNRANHKFKLLKQKELRCPKLFIPPARYSLVDSSSVIPRIRRLWPWNGGEEK